MGWYEGHGELLGRRKYEDSHYQHEAGSFSMPTGRCSRAEPSSLQVPLQVHQHLDGFCQQEGTNPDGVCLQNFKRWINTSPHNIIQTMTIMDLTNLGLMVTL